MAVDTGIELLDAIINNPMQAILLFGVIIIIRQLFFTHNGLFYDNYRHLKWSLRYDIDRQLENLLEWLERRDKVFQAWVKRTSRKQFLKYELIIWSCIFLPMIIWNEFFPENGQTNLIMLTISIVEYFALMIFAVYRYKKPKQIKKMEESNHETKM